MEMSRRVTCVVSADCGGSGVNDSPDSADFSVYDDSISGLKMEREEERFRGFTDIRDIHGSSVTTGHRDRFRHLQKYILVVLLKKVTVTAEKSYTCMDKFIQFFLTF
ncbi:uncharacterized protein LOC130769759 [Actinidia eriantha]|uniref:uncharacterized protein LOC130769759 n=1 Tax=Actinidia eriantha TaxID=165200 RepID=UPI002582E7D4|nr:uncharacterized protein LOC130769759 [Actinidia eriantha]